MDLVIEGKVLLASGLSECCIGIEGGKIKSIAKTLGRSDKRLDHSGLIIMPAGIDLHVHFRDPGMTRKEDFGTGSAAAACGGVSYILEMPNTKPPTRTLSDLKEKIAMASNKSYVDFGIAALLDEGTDVSKIAELASAFKIYLGETTGGLGISATILKTVLSKASDCGAPVFVHAEHIGALPDTVEKDLDDHDSKRSEESELDAAELVAASKHGSQKIHLLHATQAGVLSLARKSNMTAEVTPHHLLLDTNSRLGPLGKINPPLRNKSTRMRLWEAFTSGQADTIGSDHSPHTESEKGQDFNSAPSGMPGVETLLPLMLQKVAERKLAIEVLSKCCSSRPAEIIGLNKGKIQVGMDADLIVVDIRKSSKISADRLHYKCGWTPYEGMDAVFPVSTIIRGEEVARDGELSGERVGKFATPGRGSS